MNKRFVFWKKLDPDPVDDNFSLKPEYHAFFERCNENFEFRIVKGKDAYLGKGKFKNVFKYKKGKIIPAEKNFKANVVYQYTTVADESFDNFIPLLDSVNFKNWCPDKWNQYLLLKEYMPKTFLINNEEDYSLYLKEVKTEKAVIKPRRGQKGENVVVFNRDNPPKLDGLILAKKGYLLQEFADTDVVVKGLVRGIHDVKLITIKNKIFANLRIPERGKEFCTYDSPYTELKLNQLPKKVLDMHNMAKKMINAKFPNQIYTVDMGITKTGPIIFELNGHTAFPYLHFSYAENFFSSLIAHIKSLRY